MAGPCQVLGELLLGPLQDLGAGDRQDLGTLGQALGRVLATSLVGIVGGMHTAGLSQACGRLVAESQQDLGAESWQGGALGLGLPRPLREVDPAVDRGRAGRCRTRC